MASLTDALPHPPLSRPARAARPVALWLLACAGMVFVITMLGAVTRLTQSGLSMVEWKPLINIVPPLSEAAWQRVFDLYRQSPEYRAINAGMALADFKQIFFWEWLHRLCGQLIGVAFAVPFAWFLWRRRIPRRLAPQLVGLFALGGLQGFVGWFMVESGLVDRPSVSHYRLAMHLAMAVGIYALLLWTALRVLDPTPAAERPAPPAGLRRHALVALALVATTMVWGAFTAGLDAGFAYNTFPSMNGAFIPAEAWVLHPAWTNLVDNAATIQFFHRYLALTTGLVILVLGWRAWRAAPSRRLRQLGAALAAMVVVQIALGVSTLLLVVPVPLATAHQAGALLLVGLLVWTLFELRGRAPRR